MPKRLTKINFPPYVYMPGEGPHPTRDEGGFWYNRIPLDQPLTLGNWKTHQEYLYAMDLFNHGYYWETHEILEGIWNRIDTKIEIKKVLQAIIFMATAKIKEKQKRFSIAQIYQEKSENITRSLSNNYQNMIIII